MTEKLQQTIKEELEKIPREVREVIEGFDWVKITEEIGRKYLIDENEVNDLLVETLLILLQVEPIWAYTENIEKEIGTSKGTAEKIADEITEKIFNPIAEKLEENIKKDMEGKHTTAIQNIHFIISGGDYGVFLEQRKPENEIIEKSDKLLGASNILTVKDKLIN